MSSFSFIGITITENLDHHTSPPWLKKHRKGFYFLWKLRKAKFQRKIPVIFFPEEQWKAPRLETSQTTVTHARPRTGRLHGR